MWGNVVWVVVALLGSRGGAPAAGDQPLDGEAAAAAHSEPAWRELWYASLEALHREPVLNGSEAEVVAQRGGTAFLHCPVHHLGERRVSWVRRRDWHIISSGLALYTSDERFRVLHAEGSDDWVLQIKYVQRRDNGTYECQVSAGSGTLSRLLHLRVLVPEALILGAPEYHVDAGSSVSLVCIVENSGEPAARVQWAREGVALGEAEAEAGGVWVRREGGARAQAALTVRAARPHHSGNYSCSAPHAEPAYVHLYVSEGSDKMAATQSRSRAPPVPCAAPAAPLVLALAGRVVWILTIY